MILLIEKLLLTLFIISLWRIYVPSLQYINLILQIFSACDCDEKGSADTQCDQCTRKCTCHPNVDGRRCNSCIRGFWNIQSGKGCVGESTYDERY